MQKKSKIFFAIPITALMLLVAIIGSVGAAENPVVYHNWTSGNAAVECAQIGDYDGGYKIEGAAPNGTYPVDMYGNEITILNSDGNRFDWSSNFGIGAVAVKAGNGANVWFYNPQVKGDTGLYAYENKTISHVTFCWQYTLDVTKTAETSYTRNWDWTILKTGDKSELTLTDGQIYPVNYEVIVDADYTDSDWVVKGDILIENNTPVAFVVKSLEDVITPDDINATVTCPVTLPYTLATGEDLTCSYTANLSDATTRLNTATVTYYKTVGMDRTVYDTADVIFGNPTKEIDECINVSDDKYGTLGTVCAGDAPKTFEYKLNVGPYECAEEEKIYEFTNTASFKTNDTGTTGSSSWTVVVTVPACEVGCTLTQGYWKTHSEFGPAPYDDTWALLLPDGADTDFFLSDQSWYEVFWTPPAGNAYYNLAHQYMAAYLNKLNGASVPTEVQDALDEAHDLFMQYTPAEIAALKGKSGNELKAKFLELATILDNYNNGLTGPGHCSE